MDDGREHVFDLLNDERLRQTNKWGDQSSHSAERWLAILMEEVGEAAKEVVEGNSENLRMELIQSAAVIVQWLEIIEMSTSADPNS